MRLPPAPTMRPSWCRQLSRPRRLLVRSPPATQWAARPAGQGRPPVGPRRSLNTTHRISLPPRLQRRRTLQFFLALQRVNRRLRMVHNGLAGCRGHQALSPQPVLEVLAKGPPFFLPDRMGPRLDLRLAPDLLFIARHHGTFRKSKLANTGRRVWLRTRRSGSLSRNRTKA